MRPLLTLLLFGTVLGACHEGRVPVEGVSRTIGFPSARARERGGSRDEVEWRGWGEEAFRVSRKQDKPILVMIEASWCQLCTQMDRAVVDHPGVLGLIDSAFVPVLLDRDRLPAVDARLQRALRVLTGLTGWPAMVVLTPTGDPFFASTYLPASDPITGRGILEALRQASASYVGARKKVMQHAALVRDIAWDGTLEPGLIHAALADSVALWSSRDQSSNPAIAALFFELYAENGDPVHLTLARAKLRVSEESRRLGRSPVPGILEALAVGYRTTGDDALAVWLRRIVQQTEGWLDAEWRRGYTDFVGYTLGGLIEAGAALGDDAVIARGVAYLDSLTKTVAGADGTIRHSVGARGPETLWADDYAALASASASAYRATEASRHLEAVASLLDRTTARFGDWSSGAVADAAEGVALAMLAETSLFAVEDGIVPSANATIARTAVAMYGWTGNAEWLRRAGEALEAFAGSSTELARAASYGRAVRAFLDAKSNPIVR